MDPETAGAIIEAATGYWPPLENFEVSLEANPGSVESGRFAAYADAGVSRISMGVQSLLDKDLKRLGRLHTAKEARAAFEIARSHFDRVSFDMIYARQDQTLVDWTEELKEAMAMAVDHLSLYQLTIEPGTRFHDLSKRNRLKGLPSPDLSADMYEATAELTTRHGLDRYEVSNHARAGAECLHNLIYWNGGDYVGIGPGAHGAFSSGSRRFTTSNYPNPEFWLNAQEEGKSTRELCEEIEPEDQAEIYVMMGLRLRDGISKNRYLSLGGHDLAIEPLISEGYIENVDNIVRCTPKGFPVLNSVIERILRIK